MKITEYHDSKVDFTDEELDYIYLHILTDKEREEVHKRVEELDKKFIQDVIKCIINLLQKNK